MRISDWSSDVCSSDLTGLDLDRHLVGGATDSTALDLELGLDVLDRPLQRGDGLGTRLLLDGLEGRVDDALGGGALAPDEDLVDDLRDQHRSVDRIGHQLTARCGTLARHPRKDRKSTRLNSSN